LCLPRCFRKYTIAFEWLSNDFNQLKHSLAIDLIMSNWILPSAVFQMSSHFFFFFFNNRCCYGRSRAVARGSLALDWRPLSPPGLIQGFCCVWLLMSVAILASWLWFFGLFSWGKMRLSMIDWDLGSGIDLQLFTGEDHVIWWIFVAKMKWTSMFLISICVENFVANRWVG
jgi:hypothetical protein